VAERESAYLRALRAQVRAYQPSRDYGADYGVLGIPYGQEMELLQYGQQYRRRHVLMSQRVTPEMGSYASSLLTDHASLGGTLLQTLLESQIPDGPAVDEVADNDDGGLGLGIVSVHTLEMEFKLGRLTVLDVKGFPILREWYVVHREGKRFSTAAQAFKEFVLTEANQLITIPQPVDRRKTKR